MENLTENYLETQNINAKGYGVMPKLVMQDIRLTIEAKAIYAYIVTYAGAGNTAFPSLKKILCDLSIAKNRFYKHRKLLIDYGYLSVTQVFNDKREIVKNIYTLNQFPKEHTKEEPVAINISNSDPMVQNEPYPIHQNNAHKSTSIKINTIKDTDKKDTKVIDTNKEQ
ncbi:helix-turn-helix domain-containing protein [Enterococcus sp. LJL120]|uniref:helix-turn-helix domain-containing protein n=1 Tax=Enterococcus sp. HY326 TaxID=2971265 RepID=UPI00223F390A|nr:helix-turn-helix domain-containing protein [Enterococcus sp. HY326]